MIKLSSCIEMMFREVPFEDRIAEAKRVGFSAWEMWSWTNKNIESLVEATERANLPAVGCVVGSQDENLLATWQEGGMLVKDNAHLFGEMVEETIEKTEPLNIKTFIVTTGNALPNVSRDAQQEAIVESLKVAAPILEKNGCILVLEPLNILVNHMGQYLYRSDQGFEILRKVNSPNVKLLYDVYHQQITEGNLIDTIRENIDAIGHFHIADVPGRCEPGTGEINYKNVLKAILESGYRNYVGCEYNPSEGKTTEESAAQILDIVGSIL